MYQALYRLSCEINELLFNKGAGLQNFFKIVPQYCEKERIAMEFEVSLQVKKSYIYYLFAVLTLFTLNLQETRGQTSLLECDSLIRDQSQSKYRRSAYHLHYTKFVVPAVFIGYGTISLNNNGLKQLDISTRDEINEHRPYKTTLDNYTQYAPTFMVYALNAAGIKGTHNFKDRSIIYATSQLISASFVLPIKHLVQEERPDGSNRLSFPSGHTATAFSSAHFMFREYREHNFWLGASGYSFALFTGVYRTLNNKHWVSDVVAGAGFGILSTELSYWLYPKINGLIHHRASTSNSMLFPSYQDGTLMLGMIRNF